MYDKSLIKIAWGAVLNGFIFSIVMYAFFAEINSQVSTISIIVCSCVYLVLCLLHICYSVFVMIRYILNIIKNKAYKNILKIMTVLMVDFVVLAPYYVIITVFDFLSKQ